MGLLLSHKVILPSLALQTIQKVINSPRIGAMGNTDLVMLFVLVTSFHKKISGWNRIKNFQEMPL